MKGGRGIAQPLMQGLGFYRRTEMAAIFITVASEKGGVAKTTTSANLLTMLSLMGFRVLGLDCDPQGGLTFSFGINRDHLKKSLYEALLSTARGSMTAPCRR